MTVRLAIVILNWNGAAMLRRYLPSVLRCSQSDGVAVIVADNASTDDSLRVLEEQFADVRVIRLERNYGFAEGYNSALAQIDAAYYLLLNSDVEIRQERWTEPLLAFMDAHAEVAACMPRLLDLKDTARYEYAGAAGGFLDRYGYPFCRGRLLSSVEAAQGQYDTPLPVLWATGAALMVRREDYERSGGLDTRFFAHMEEIDLCWRLRIMGRGCACVPASTAYHLGGATLHQGNPRKTFLNFRNNLLMLYKNLPERDLGPVLRTRALLDLVAAAQMLVKGDVKNCRAVLRAARSFRKMRPLFAADRRRIQAYREAAAARQQTEGGAPFIVARERTAWSLLWQYYVRRRTRFADLPQ